MQISSENHVYTATEHATWRHFFQEIERVWAEHGDLIHPYYMAEVDVLRRFQDQVPSLSQVNGLLREVGWSAVYVDGLAPPWEIAKLLDRRMMPVSRQIRSPGEVFFANGPDLIHDMFGHLPCLFNRDYRQMLAEWSHVAARLEIDEIDKANYHLNKVMVQAQDRVEAPVLVQLQNAVHGIDAYVARYPSPSLQFDKAYFWIFEFGLVREHGQLKILGAGLLSSMNEIRRLATGDFAEKPLNMETVLSPYNISTLQEGYVVAPHLRSYSDLIGAMVERLVPPAVREERRYAHA